MFFTMTNAKVIVFHNNNEMNVILSSQCYSILVSDFYQRLIAIYLYNAVSLLQDIIVHNMSVTNMYE